MPKAYWISAYTPFPIRAFAAYAKIAGLRFKVQAAAFLRAVHQQRCTSTSMQRVVLIEFESVAQAIATHAVPHIRKRCACSARVDRDLRIVEGV